MGAIMQATRVYIKALIFGLFTKSFCTPLVLAAFKRGTKKKKQLVTAVAIANIP